MEDEIRQVEILPRGFAVLGANPPGLFVFGEDGRFVRSIGSTGSGPFEFSNPLAIAAEGDLVHVWDASGHKVISYSSGGDDIREVNLRLYRLDLETMAVDSTHIADDAFALQSSEYVDDIQDIVNEFDESIAFISGSSRVVGAHLAGDLVAVEIEHGTVPFDESTPNTRWSRIHLYDSDLTRRATIEVHTEMRTRLGGSIAAADAEHLYFVRAPESDEASWVLTAVRIPNET